MPRERVIRRRNVPQDFIQFLEEYLLNRSMREKSEIIERERKGILMDVLEQVGVLQEGGHRTIELDDPLVYYHYARADKATEKKVTGIERKQRAGRMDLNPDRVMAYLKEKGLLDRCTETVQVLNEDEVLAANYDGTIPDEDMEKLYDQADPTFAFYLITE